MTARLILFIAFILIGGSIIYTGKNKSYYNESRNLNLATFNNLQNEKVKIAQEIEAKKNGTAILVEAKSGPDLTNPLVKKGQEIYVGAGQCLRCHGENGEGNVTELAPVIAGQHDWYIEDQLGQMKTGKRVNDKMMPFLKDISASDFKALAAYIKDLRVK